MGAYNGRGLAYMNISDFTRAISDFSWVISIITLADNSRGLYWKPGDRPTNLQISEVYRHRGLAYIDTNEFSKAIADFNETIRLNPNYTAAYFNRGYAYANIGDWRRANTDWETVLRAYPNHNAVIHNIRIARQHLLTGNNDIIEFYNHNRSAFIQAETVHLFLIQVPYGNDMASRNRARELINKLNTEIAQNPVTFDEVSQRGREPNSGFLVGDAGILPRNTEAANLVGMDFLNAAFSLRLGEVSGVIEGQNGFFIIKNIASYPQKQLELDDIILGHNITIRNHIRNMIMSQELRRQ